MMLSTETFAELTEGTVHHSGGTELGKPSIDSRTLVANDTFFALEGPRFDGHDFLGAALERGAGTVVIHHDRASESMALARAHSAGVISVENTETALQAAGVWYRSQYRGRVVGITGSSGKTTTKDMLRTALRPHGDVVATRGNLNNHLGVPLSLAQLTTQPEFAVFEMGMNAPGEILTLSQWVSSDVAVITSIGEAHLEGVGSLEGVANAKGELFETLTPQGTAICPSNVPFFEHLKGIAGDKLRTIGSNANDTCRVISERVEGACSTVDFILEGQSYQLSLPCIGAHHVSNALCALMTVSVLGFSLEPSINALAHFELPEMRGQRFELDDGVAVSLDCYNANPQSMRAAIEAHMQQSSVGSVLVLGDMLELGEHSQRAHAALGHYLNEHVPEAFVIAVGASMKHCFDVLTQSDRRVDEPVWCSHAPAAAEALKAHLGSNMNILIKGSRGLKLETVWHELQN